MNPYDIDIRKIKESKRITDSKLLCKLELASKFVKITSKMTPKEISEITGLNKSDISRLRTTNVERFSIDKLVDLLDILGCSVKISFKSKKAS